MPPEIKEKKKKERESGVLKALENMIKKTQKDKKKEKREREKQREGERKEK